MLKVQKLIHILYHQEILYQSKDESDTIYHAKVVKVNSSDPAELILDKVITETGVITKITRGIRMKFTDAEIQSIKTQKIDDAQIQSFTLYYDLISVKLRNGNGKFGTVKQILLVRLLCSTNMNRYKNK